MRHFSIPFGVAFSQVARARAVVFPNEGFRALLVAETKVICPTLSSAPLMAGNPFRKKATSPVVVSKPPAILDMVWAVLDTDEQRRVANHFSVLSGTSSRVDIAMTDRDRMALILFARGSPHSPWLPLTKIKIVMWMIFKVRHIIIGFIV